jgi:hypothetical protein
MNDEDLRNQVIVSIAVVVVGLCLFFYYLDDNLSTAASSPVDPQGGSGFSSGPVISGGSGSGHAGASDDPFKRDADQIENNLK